MSAYNGSGTFVITGTGLPFVTGTTISSTVANQLNTDLATGLSTAVTKDGQTTTTASIPFALGLSANALVNISNAAAGQIQFPPIQNASANANTLDDYEEGTFAPTLTFGGGSTGMFFNSQLGTYTKIGDTVNFRITLILFAKGSSTGAALVGALPFTANNDSVFTPCAGAADAMTTVSDFVARISPNTATISLYNFTASSLAALTEANFQNASVVTIAGQYRAA